MKKRQAVKPRTKNQLQAAQRLKDKTFALAAAHRAAKHVRPKSNGSWWVGTSREQFNENLKAETGRLTGVPVDDGPVTQVLD